MHKLIQEHPIIDIQKMGFAEDWENDPFWSGNTLVNSLQPQSKINDRKKFIVSE